MAKSNFSVSFGIIRFSVFQLVLFCSKIARNGQNSEMPTETVCSLFSWMEWREKMLPQHHPNPNIACPSFQERERGSLARSLTTPEEATGLCNLGAHLGRHQMDHARQVTPTRWAEMLRRDASDRASLVSSKVQRNKRAMQWSFRPAAIMVVKMALRLA